MNKPSKRVWKTFQEAERERIQIANDKWLKKDKNKTNKNGACSLNHPWGNHDRRWVREVDEIKKI